jgi:hypothetical protein
MGRDHRSSTPTPIRPSTVELRVLDAAKDVERVVERRHRESHVRFLKFRPAIKYFDEGQAILR